MGCSQRVGKKAGEDQLPTLEVSRSVEKQNCLQPQQGKQTRLFCIVDVQAKGHLAFPLQHARKKRNVPNQHWGKYCSCQLSNALYLRKNEGVKQLIQALFTPLACFTLLHFFLLLLLLSPLLPSLSPPSIHLFTPLLLF